MQRFKERLVARRNALGWTQVTLAEKSGVSERAIAGYESKGNEPSADVLGKLAEVMGVTRGWLLGEDVATALREQPSKISTPATNTASPFSWMQLSTLDKTLADLSQRLQKATPLERKHIIGNIADVVAELEQREIRTDGTAPEERFLDAVEHEADARLARQREDQGKQRNPVKLPPRPLPFPVSKKHS